jgi:hypothetical protein
LGDGRHIANTGTQSQILLLSSEGFFFAAIVIYMRQTNQAHQTLKPPALLLQPRLTAHIPCQYTLVTTTNNGIPTTPPSSRCLSIIRGEDVFFFALERVRILPFFFPPTSLLSRFFFLNLAPSYYPHYLYQVTQHSVRLKGGWVNSHDHNASKLDQSMSPYSSFTRLYLAFFPTPRFMQWDVQIGNPTTNTLATS